MLWVDKHRPKDLGKLDYHDELTKQLSTIALSGNMPHMLFYGPSGAGKKTRIMALLKGIFGPSVYKLKLEQRSFKTPSKQTVDVRVLLGPLFFSINQRPCCVVLLSFLLFFFRSSFSSFSISNSHHSLLISHFSSIVLFTRFPLSTRCHSNLLPQSIPGHYAWF